MGDLQAQPEKKMTQVELAVKTAFVRYPQAQVTILSTFGGAWIIPWQMFFAERSRNHATCLLNSASAK